MGPYYKPWQVFALDMNADGQLTVSDVAQWLYRAFFLPGDTLLWALAVHAPEVANFLELPGAGYGSVASALISGAVWLVVFLLLVGTISRVRAADRAVTGRLRAGWSETVRLGRVARNRMRRR